MLSPLTIRGHNLIGNILTGLCALVLGFTWLFDSTGLSVPVAALLLLIFSSHSLLLCLNNKHEVPDEMARAHEGISSSIALKALLLSCALICCIEAIAQQSVPVAPACCICIGFGLIVYGMAFASLEREQ